SWTSRRRCSGHVRARPRLILRSPAVFRRSRSCSGFCFNATAPTDIYTLSLHDALPILPGHPECGAGPAFHGPGLRQSSCPCQRRSEEHTSELQSRFDLVCRLLLEKKNAREEERASLAAAAAAAVEHPRDEERAPLPAVA